MTSNTHTSKHFPNTGQHKSFTERELDILACIITGRTSRKSIASALNISTATVASYMRGIMQKLECSSWEYVRAYIESENMVDFLREHYKNSVCSETVGLNRTQRLPYFKSAQASQDDLQGSTVKTVHRLLQTNIRMRRFITIPLILSILFILWGAFRITPHYIRSEFILPETQYLLPRERLINEIKKALREHNRDNNKIPVVTLVGIGGAGKTTTARMLAQHHKGLTWEINAESRASVMASFRKLAYYVATSKDDKERIEFIQRIPSPIEQELQFVLFIKDKIQNHPGWLLVYDNVESFNELQEYFPYDTNVWGTGAVILTTRNENLKIGHQIRIPELNQDESLKLFCMSTNSTGVMQHSEKKELSEFIQKLPPYPLDIAIAARYIYATHTSREEYLKSFYHKSRNVEFKKALHDDYNYTQTREDILNLTLTRLLKENPQYLGLLVVISALDSQNIPIDLCERFDRADIVQDFIRQLKKASLITVSSKHSREKQGMYIHRTIQAYIVAWLRNNPLIKETMLDEHLSKLVCLMEKTIHDNIREENYERHLELIPHINKLLTSSELSPQDKVILSAANTCMQIDLEQMPISDLDTMKSFVSQLSLDPYSYRSMLTLSYYGYSLCNFGRYLKALNIFEKCVDMLYEKYPESLEYYRVVRELGVFYRVIGRYREAQMYFDSCKKVFELFPKREREKAEIIAQIGLLLRDTGKYVEAEKLLRESVELISKKNPFLEKILQPYFWLHTIYLELGYPKKLLEGFSNTSTTKAGILLLAETQRLGYNGVCEYHIGNYEKARKILEDVYKTDLQTGYIQNYNSFKLCLPILGKVYIHFNRYKEARNVLETCLMYAEQLYGKNKFQNGRIMCYLGDLELAEGKLDLAENKMVQAYTLFKEVDHTDMYIPLESLAALYKERFENARKVQDIVGQEKCYEQYKKYLTETNKIIQERFPADSDHVKRITKKLKALK